MLVLSRWRGEGGLGGSKSSTSCTLFSHCPYFFVPFSADSHPLLCFSHYDVNDVILSPYCNRECFGLVQNKKLCCKSNHSTLSSMIIEAAFPWHKFTPRGKIFSVFNSELQSYGASSQEDLPWKDFSPSYWKYWDRSKWSLRTFDLTCVVILTENFDS